MGTLPAWLTRQQTFFSLETRKHLSRFGLLRTHPNIVALLGLITVPNNHGLVDELMQTSLLEHVVSSAAALDGRLLMRWTRQLAAAVAALHELDVVARALELRQYVSAHRSRRHNSSHDSAVTDRVFLDADQNAKLRFSTMMLSQYEEPETTSRARLGAVRTMAPESLKQRLYSQSSDTWSFGVIVGAQPRLRARAERQRRRAAASATTGAVSRSGRTGSGYKCSVPTASTRMSTERGVCASHSSDSAQGAATVLRPKRSSPTVDVERGARAGRL